MKRIAPFFLFLLSAPGLVCAETSQIPDKPVYLSRRYRKPAARSTVFKKKTTKRKTKTSKKVTKKKKSSRSKRAEKKKKAASPKRAVKKKSPPKKIPVQRSKKAKSGAVDLSKVGKKPSGRPSRYQYPSAKTQSKNIRLYFDIVLSYRANDTTALKFDNYHTALLLEYVPRPDFQFSMGFAPPDVTPRYYEIQYDVKEWMRIRAGRIWIPFDQINPHNTFGGIYNTSQLRASNQEAFLPDVWSDLGIAARFSLLESSNLTIYQHVYVVNGFHDGGTDPLGEATSYPEFESISADEEANNDKAIGLRTELLFGSSLLIGTSFYTGRYTDQTSPSARVTMFGADFHLDLSSKIRVRGGYVLMRVGLPEGTSRQSFLRGGMYTEAIFKLNPRWRFHLKGGLMQNDDGVSDQNDRTIIGARVNFRPNHVLSLSLEHHRDIKKITGKQGTAFTGLILAIIL